jgi:hypothetical protein
MGGRHAPELLAVLLRIMHLPIQDR